MKAAILHSADSVPVYGDFDEPAAGEGSEIVELVAAGIHHAHPVGGGRASLRQRRGLPGHPRPQRSGAHRRWRSLVFSSSGPPPYGTFAERFASPGAMRFPLPAGAQPEAVAAGVNPGMASWLPLRARQAEAGKLGTVLILGVTGMSGFLAAQNARLLGATRVVGSGRSQAGLERARPRQARRPRPSPVTGTDADALAKAARRRRARPGARLPLGTRRRDRLPGPGPPDEFGEDSADIKYVQIGALAGAEAAVPSGLLRSRKLTISGSGAGSVAAADIKAQIPAYIRLIADGSVQVPFRTFPLSDAGAAWTASAESDRGWSWCETRDHDGRLRDRRGGLTPRRGPVDDGLGGRGQPLVIS